MNLQNVPCVANQQLSDAQDVKQSGTVKGNAKSNTGVNTSLLAI